MTLWPCDHRNCPLQEKFRNVRQSNWKRHRKFCAIAAGVRASKRNTFAGSGLGALCAGQYLGHRTTLCDLPGRRSIKKAHQAAWLARAITCIDLTTLSGDDTEARVRRLCAKARQPVRADILEALGLEGPITTGAVCVYHEMVPAAVRAVAGSGLPVAAVSTGFPAGLSPFPPAHSGNPRKRGSWCRRNRHRDLAAARAARRLASALR